MLEKILMERLRGYIAENNPDVLLKLQDTTGLTTYLQDMVMAVQPQLEEWIGEGKPQYMLEELCMNAMTASLRPSKFNYLKELLEEDFAGAYEQFRKAGVLTYELVNMVEASTPVFDAWQFSLENEDDRMLRYAITGAVDEYLHSSRH